MSLLATSLRKPKTFSLKGKATTPKRSVEKPPESLLPSPKFDEVRRKKRATDLPKFAEVRAKKKAPFYEGLPLDLFDIDNVAGQRVIDALYQAITDIQAEGVKLFPAMPTVTAYQTELEILQAIAEEPITDDRLRELVDGYIETHTGDSIGAWTDRSVTLFYMTLRENGETVDGYTANYIQVCIIRELWLRTSPEASFDLTRL